MSSKSAKNVVTLDNLICAEQYGVVADDSTDNATALQAAVTAAIGKKLILPFGTVRSSAAINITGAIQIMGHGRDVTVCKLMSATMNFWNITSDSAVLIKDMSFTAGQTQTAGAAIKVDGGTPGVTENAKSRFENLNFNALYDSIKFVAANTWVIDDIRSTNIINTGVTVNNSVNGDSGDNAILVSYFQGSGADGILHNGAGGLRVIGNKFNLLGRAYHLDWTNAQTSTQLSFVGNHVDACSIGGLVFERSSGSAGFGRIGIVGNHINTTGSAPGVWFKTNNASYVSSIILCGNYYNLATGNGVQIDGGTQFNISGETIQSTGAGSVGIATGNSTAQSISIGPEQFYAVTTNLSITSISQLASSVFGSTVSKPKQPSFLGRKTANTANVTGDGTFYTVIPDSSDFDQASNYNAASGVFTAPVAGKYQLSACVQLATLGAGHTEIDLFLITTGKTFQKVNIVGTRAETSLAAHISVEATMAASDTALVQIYVAGSTKTVTVAGGTNALSWFSGSLVA